MIRVEKKRKLSVRVRVLATVGALIAAVLLPQAIHLLGRAAGVGSLPGEMLLPMHLPILLAGLLAGPVAGAVSGAFAPLLSALLTGMPASAMLPFMMIELCVYGLVSGLLSRVRMATLLKVLIAQVAGRALRAVAILVAVYGFPYAALPVSVIWTSILTGLIGIALQWILLPLIVYRVEHGGHDVR